MVIAALAVLAALVPAQDTVTLREGARGAAYAKDGRLAFELRGDLWVMRPGGGAAAVRLTEGPWWDRDASWSADGRWLVFGSDRSGREAVWSIDLDESGEVVGEARRVSGGEVPASDPTVGPDGAVVYVRGTSSSADLWLREPDGPERRLTTESGADVEPAFSPDGGSVAYVAERDGVRTLRVLRLEGGESVVVADGSPARPSWSPDGRRIAYGSASRSGGVWVVDAAGGVPLPVSVARASASWSPDGEWIALAEQPSPEVGYNGDPDRVGDRSAGDVFRGTGGLRRVPAPRPPDQDAVEIPIEARVARSSHNADAFDRVFARVAALYSGAGDGGLPADWRALRERHRTRALAASSDAELEQSIHAMLVDRPSAREEATGRAAVSSAHALATAAGLEILNDGGNVVDAAVAVSFALGVVEPDASGIGGYGEMLIHLSGMPEPVAIEFMTRVPEAAGLSNPSLRELPPDGPVLANVPGTVAGMELAWRKYGSGRVAWRRLLEPAILIAEKGFEIDDGFATTLRRERQAFEKYESSRALFFRGGAPLQAGDTLRNADLAWTLRQIADHGAEAFYRGEPARRLVADLRARGNPITLEDMRRYFAVERQPVRGEYRGHAVYSGPPPVTGGALLVAKLHLLEQAPAGASLTDDAAKLHALIEAWKLQPSTAERIADPDLWPIDLSPFESRDTAKLRWRCFDARRSSTPQIAADGCAASDAGGSGDDRDLQGTRSTGTTAYAVADAEGNAVSVTQTLGTWGGNFYVTPGLGFLHNDKLRSYRTDPDAYNARISYARNTTVISPTIVFDGVGPDKRPLLAVGAAGNAWIVSAVYQAVVGVIDHGLGPQAALELPRLLPGGRPTQDGRGVVIQMEDGISPAAVGVLEAMGHSFERISLRGELRMGYGAAVMIRDGRAIAGADPRRSGAAGAVN